MQPTYWRLKYDRQVITTLYQLRERGYALHDHIKSLKFMQDPRLDAITVPERPGRYEFEFQGYWVGFEESKNPEDKEPTLIILYIQAGA